MFTLALEIASDCRGILSNNKIESSLLLWKKKKLKRAVFSNCVMKTFAIAFRSRAVFSFCHRVSIWRVYLADVTNILYHCIIDLTAIRASVSRSKRCAKLINFELFRLFLTEKTLRFSEPLQFCQIFGYFGRRLKWINCERLRKQR